MLVPTLAYALRDIMHHEIWFWLRQACSVLPNRMHYKILCIMRLCIMRMSTVCIKVFFCNKSRFCTFSEVCASFKLFVWTFMCPTKFTSEDRTDLLILFGAQRNKVWTLNWLRYGHATNSFRVLNSCLPINAISHPYFGNSCFS